MFTELSISVFIVSAIHSQFPALCTASTDPVQLQVIPEMVVDAALRRGKVSLDQQQQVKMNIRIQFTFQCPLHQSECSNRISAL